MFATTVRTASRKKVEKKIKNNKNFKFTSPYICKCYTHNSGKIVNETKNSG